jgi:hypothetical protein
MRYGKTSENLRPLSASSKRQEADFKALSSEFQASGREKPTVLIALYDTFDFYAIPRYKRRF